MRNSFALYRLAGHRFVGGWLESQVLDIVATLDAVQCDKGIFGSVAEIGVHRGRFFIGLYLLLRSGEWALAIDIFGDQHLNVDGSGRGDLDGFLANLRRWVSQDRLAIHQGDSVALDGATVRQRARSDVRLFSIDGGHTEEIVFADLNLAEAALADGGVVIADDVFNQMWPGVVVGTLRYLRSGDGLAPFAIGFNKVFLAQPAYVELYRHALETKYQNTMRISVESSVFAGHQVASLFRTPRTPRRLLRKNATALSFTKSRFISWSKARYRRSVH
jgi:Methyltransferase domain